MQSLNWQSPPKSTTHWWHQAQSHFSPTCALHLLELTEYIYNKLFYYTCLSEKAMAPHSSTLAWKIPWTEEPRRLQSMGSRRVGHDWSDLAAAAAYLFMNTIICFITGSFPIGWFFSSFWVMFSCFLTCLVISYSMLHTLNFTLMNTVYFYIAINILYILMFLYRNI